MKKILIIDNEKGICDTVEDFFKERGYTVISALTGRGGLDAFIVERPHIVIIDLYLTDISGFAVLEKIRGMDDSCLIIVITGSAQEDDKIRALELGANFYITKPFSLKELLK